MAAKPQSDSMFSNPFLLGRIACVAYMLYTATDVGRTMVCVSVCVGHTGELCKKPAKPIEMPFGGLSRVK